MTSNSDLAYLALAVPDLQDYLFSQELFWPLPAASASLGVPGLGQMTLGGVVLALARLACVDAHQAREYEGKVELVRTRWRSNWSKKAAREYSARVGLWGRTVEDIVSESGSKRAGYPAQVRIRLMLDLLQTEMVPEKPQEIEYLVGYDARLRAAVHPGSFVWEPNLADCFPANPYWYLYIHL
jgi:hypothetical protein